MFQVYVIQSESSHKIYIGQTSNVEVRLMRHNKVASSKNTSYTSKNTGPWKLLYTEEYKTRSDARQREKQLKSARGRAFIKTLSPPIAQFGRAVAS